MDLEDQIEEIKKSISEKDKNMYKEMVKIKEMCDVVHKYNQILKQKRTLTSGS